MTDSASNARRPGSKPVPPATSDNGSSSDPLGCPAGDVRPGAGADRPEDLGGNLLR